MQTNIRMHLKRHKLVSPGQSPTSHGTNLLIVNPRKTFLDIHCIKLYKTLTALAVFSILAKTKRETDQQKERTKKNDFVLDLRQLDKQQ